MKTKCPNCNHVFFADEIEEELTHAKTSNDAFMKPFYPDAVLAQIIGTGPFPRTEITKRLWDYIKEHKLQDPINRRMIHSDDLLYPIFHKSQLSMFEMGAHLAAHISEEPPMK